jgi:hypothetical protein
MESKLAAIAKFCAENEGSFSLVCHGRDGHWSSMCNFGREAPDSPMVAGSALGSGDTAEEAIDGVVSDLKLEVVDAETARDAAAAEEGAGC